jgi:hypothetical protein
MATLADLLRTGYKPPTDSALADPIKEHFRTLPQQLEANQRAMDKTMAGMDKTDIMGKPNPNYYPEAMQEFTQNYAPNVMGSIQKVTTPVAKAIMSEFVPGVRAGEEMLVHHNLSPEKLYGAEKLGGMPVPSLAISKTNEPLSSFGDITLIGSKDMAIPSKTNLAFKSDAYTARKPQIVYDMDYKSQDKFKKLFSDVLPDLPRGEHQLGNLLDDFSRARDSEVVQAKFLKENSLMPKQADYPDKWQYSEAITKARQANQGNYDQWFDDFTSKLPQEGVNIKEKIFKGYTQSGNRRYAEANLENIVKEMKGGAGSEGFNYGVGNIRAIATPKFKNFDEIVKNRDKLVSEADFKPIKEKATENYIDLVGRLRKLSNYSADDAILEAVENKNFNNLDRIYGEVPKDLKADIGVFIEGLKKMPTEYFEIKPQRGVKISEFKGALVPSDLPDKARTILEKAGIKEIYTYANAEERKALTKKFGKDMFSGIPALPLAMPNEDKAKTRQQMLEEQFNKKSVK